MAIHFFRHLGCAGLVLAMLAVPLTAQSPAAKNPVVTEQYLQAAIHAHDIDTVENSLVEAQARFLNGRISADDMRDLYARFKTTDPDVIAFVEKWLERSPDSAHANAAQAWVYFTAGWNFHSGNGSGDPYPGALKAQSDLHQKSWKHAGAAFDADPRLIPASDALIQLAVTTDKHRVSLIVFDGVMRADPNMGSLMHALKMTAPEWGGRWSLVKTICDFYGPMVEYRIEPVLYCKLKAAYDYHYASQAEWINQMIRENGLDELDYMLMPAVTSPAATPEEIEFAFEYLNRDRVTNVDFAASFDNHFALRLGYEQQYPKHLSRARAEARKRLQYDPYNQQSLATLLKPVIVEYIGDDGVSYFRTIEESTREEQLDYVRRQLISNPYEPDYWREYINVNARADNFKSMFDVDPYLLNIVAYSNHSPQALTEYIEAKRAHLFAMGRTDHDVLDDRIREAQKTGNTDRDIICPLIRAERILTTICHENNDSYCRGLVFKQEMIEETQLDARERKVCSKELDSDLSELLYLPVSIPEATVGADQ